MQRMDLFDPKHQEQQHVQLLRPIGPASSLAPVYYMPGSQAGCSQSAVVGRKISENKTRLLEVRVGLDGRLIQHRTQ